MITIHGTLMLLGSFFFMLGGVTAVTGQPKETVFWLNSVAVVLVLAAIYCKLP